ncbi:hypothetical protein BBSC_0717 [Bifidobacterium scardovii JCM 12489 = DSM 13734]|nr:hypothetical protein BBSC_0717 [Bifidobacterium scardovii JCM 12489 = DSM 13734]
MRPAVDYWLDRTAFRDPGTPQRRESRGCRGGAEACDTARTGGQCTAGPRTTPAMWRKTVRES